MIIKKPKEKECDIQSACITWFRKNINDGIIFSVPNEACYKRKSYFEKLGLLSGVSDTVVILNDKVIFIEFKAPKCYQRPEQRLFEDKIIALGFQYYVVHSVEEFINIINNN